ncbi:MAG: SUF system NifU family Fe-S cluster assembly protein [Leptotrichiaceae bacterium]|jgi:nitrogen fixation NifU-like protein|nr:SUF system NifU family Fe-S cluster assembly protein [Leptotrichiaceae bacterium]MBP7026622.1 SUF system NifU family Fe-S cluster assembly protein [Leptotrichiaceae bacterium]MBP8637053.1 SUF system NifU family Fe-S cluster assembly protein [Leptotrichiaceae bacterium]MBP9538734.1 SUF system NifU family Fe-S cluster assembly protein [Leptotrichiaceae bacterium]MBP9876023.1 SUF system NifU family Fe-S cluster assembly protein [Leptotrichiaceae bacterium]
MNLERIYQQTILDYNNRKDLKKELDDPTYIERGHNPNCGDDLTLEVRLSEDKIVEDASFLGNGCAISTASTAMLIDMIKGKSLENAKEKVELYFKMMKQDEKLTADETKKLGDAVLMEYVAKMPARVKCATLSWHSMKVIVDKEENK